jgi:hypothetical protein
VSFLGLNLSGENDVILSNSTIFSLVELGNLSELGRKQEKETVMKNFLKKNPRSGFAEVETPDTSDQENVASEQSNVPSVSAEETDLFANAIKLPSDSSGARKILKSSAVRASGQIVFGTNSQFKPPRRVSDDPSYETCAIRNERRIGRPSQREWGHLVGIALCIRRHQRDGGTIATS